MLGGQGRGTTSRGGVPVPEVHLGARLERVVRDTLPQIFWHAVDTHGVPEAMLYKEAGEWRRLAHAEVAECVSRLAAGLDGLGLARGDRVALLSENRPEWAIVDYAVLGLGSINVPLYPTLSAEQLEFILNDCGAKVIFVSSAEQLARVLAIRERLAGLERIYTFEPTPGGEHFRAVMQHAAGCVGADARTWFRKRSRSVSPGEVATLIYTSGTTGSPKGVMLTHFNLAAMVVATRQHGSIPVQPGEVALSFLPLSHVFERAVAYYYWDSGVTIAYAEAAGKVADNLREVRPHVMVSVPRFFEKMHARVMSRAGLGGQLARWAARTGEAWLEAQEAGHAPSLGLRLRHALVDRLVFSGLRERIGGRVRVFICGGAPLAERFATFFWAAGLPIHEGYGLTETSPVLTANCPKARRIGTVGVPYPGVELRLDTSGEILARGPSVTPGYWNNPAATAEAIDAEGWFHTGDVGEFDADGFLRITDRIKNLIVTAGGKKLAPQPIEIAASVSPYVAQVVMIGDGRPYPVLLVVPDFDALLPWAAEHGLDTADRERLYRDATVHDFLQRETLGRLQGLARYELPKKIAVIPRELSVESGTLTPTLKMRRRAVAELYRELIEGLYSEPRKE